LWQIARERVREVPSIVGADVTGLLRAWSQGDPGAAEKLVPLVYDDLKRRAARYLRRERREHTLRPTALVHETYLRLVGQDRVAWKSRAQFFGVAAQVMRRILVDHARERGAAKRAGGWCRVSLDEDIGAPPRDVDLVELEDALQDLSALDPEKVRMVELRFFAGLNIDETAEVLGVSPSTVTREWRMARAWLHRRLRRERTGARGPRTPPPA
jgi:RNA polymerase sigma factor (TIGR02999 family)